MNIETLKAARLAARKSHNRVGAGSLATMIAEIEYEQEKGKVIDATAIVSKINKYIENAYDNAKHEPMNPDHALEAEFLEGLLPEMMTEEKILSVISEAGITSIGMGMGLMRKNYAGKYENSVAAKVIKGYLANK